MSMLAEPRRKQKIINLRAKNNAWSNDTNKFGQRMLEKMGWSSGKGLGAKENGIVEHVVARYKNDDKGLGYEDRNDQWTKHEDDFNALLANLSNEKDPNAETLHSGVSLEVKSKKSKARIHYHKFTRGKDISRYSEKDLANIFGKKSFNSEGVVDTIQEDLKTTEQVFTEKGSMEDYFKTKMDVLKLKNKVNISINKSSNENFDTAFRGFSGASNDENNDINAENETNKSLYSIFVKEKNDDAQDQKLIKKSKKNKSKNKEVPDLLEDPKESTEVLQLEEPGMLLKRKKKKSKAANINNRNVETINVKKKKDKHNMKKDSIPQEDTCLNNQECIVEENYIPKKKKKRKNKDL